MRVKVRSRVSSFWRDLAGRAARPRFSGAIWGVLFVLVLAVAGVTHAVAVLALPWRSHRDAFARVAAVAPVGLRTALPDADTANGTIPFRDPGLVMAVCRYDLGVQPFRLSLAPFDTGFVTIGFHARHGLAFYGLTVRAADATRLDLRLVAKTDNHGAAPDAEQRVIAVETPEPEGFVLLATPAGDDVDRKEARDRLASMQCRTDATPP